MWNTTRHASGDNRGRIPLNHEAAPPWTESGEGESRESNRRGAKNTNNQNENGKEEHENGEEAPQNKDRELPTGQKTPAKEGNKGQVARQSAQVEATKDLKTSGEASRLRTQ